MKHLAVCFVALLCLAGFCQSYSQSVAINTSGAAAHPSAMLDVSASNKGFLLPRMTAAQRAAISSPATGLQVFDSTSKSLWVYNGTAWVELSMGSASNFWTLNGNDIYKNNTGNVGIGLTAPLAPLHIKNDNEALRIQGTTSYVSFYDDAGTTVKGFIQQYNNNFFLGTPSSNPNGYMQFYLANQPIVTIRPEGQVVIGSSGTSYSNTGLSISQDGSAIIGLTANVGRTEIITTNNLLLSPQGGFGNVGINTQSPANRLQIGSVGASNFSTNDFAIGNGSNAMAILQTNTSTLFGSTTDMSFRPRNNGTGNFGINVLAPTNKLQVGSVGNTGFATNDFAIGNGINAMAIFQTDASTLIGSSTDIVLRPRNNGAGRVGINTNNPRAPLDVTDFVTRPGSYYSYLNRDAWTLNVRDCQDCLPAISIFASNAVFAAEFDAFSDARIKEIVGKSNGANDLQIINALQITDYKMKDKVKYGNKQFKKVIAQEVEKIYPQVVSKHTDFIPNVYQVTSEITKVEDGYLLQFANNHTISASAKKLRVLLNETAGMQEVDILSVPSKTSVVIRANDIKTAKAFMYGEEVSDFRTVDYEGLTTLNISATQELSKLVKMQQSQIEEQNKKIARLTEAVKAMMDTRLAHIKYQQ